ncbi:MAG: hypothetical protein AB7L84_15965 [Acidimicrobiia bacterium]
MTPLRKLLLSAVLGATALGAVPSVASADVATPDDPPTDVRPYYPPRPWRPGPRPIGG